MIEYCSSVGFLVVNNVFSTVRKAYFSIARYRMQRLSGVKVWGEHDFHL